MNLKEKKKNERRRRRKHKKKIVSDTQNSQQNLMTIFLWTKHFTKADPRIVFFCIRSNF